MRNALMPLRWFLVRLLMLVVMCFGLVLMGAFVGPILIPFGLAILFIASVTATASNRRLFKLCKQVRFYRTLFTERISVHYSADLSDLIERERLVDYLEADYCSLAKWFSFHLKQRAAIYLFQKEEDVSRLYGGPCGGFAVIEHNAIVIALSESYRTLFRHELAHLFAAQLGSSSPAFKCEGLCVWLQCDGRAPILDEAAKRCLDTDGLAAFLRPHFFSDPRNRQSGYCVAGSFTAFLIDYFGRDRYRQFYVAARQRNFHRTFEQQFGVSLARAEALWKDAMRR